MFLKTAYLLLKYILFYSLDCVFIDAPLLFETKVLRYITFPICNVFISNDDIIISRV